MPSSPGYERDYKREAMLAKKRGEQGTGPNGDNAKRKRLRRAMLKKGMVKPGQDVAHKVALSKGGSNTVANAKAESPSGNRSFARTKSGALKSEVSKRER